MALACLATFVSASATTKYAALSTAAAGRVATSTSRVDRDRGAADDGRQRGVEPAVLEDHRVDAANQVADLLERRLGLLVGGDHQLAPGLGSVSSFSFAAPRSAASATSRCWAPSWRSRSIRRRSASALSTAAVRLVSSRSTWAACSTSALGPSSARASTTFETAEPDRDPRRHDHESEHADAGSGPRAGTRRDLEEVELGRVAGQGVDVGGQRQHRRRAGPGRRRQRERERRRPGSGRGGRRSPASGRPNVTRSRRRPNHDVAVNGGTGSPMRTPGHRRDTRSLDLAEPARQHEQHPGERQRQHERDQQCRPSRRGTRPRTRT